MCALFTYSIFQTDTNGNEIDPCDDYPPLKCPPLIDFGGDGSSFDVIPLKVVLGHQCGVKRRVSFFSSTLFTSLFRTDSQTLLRAAGINSLEDSSNAFNASYRYDGVTLSATLHYSNALTGGEINVYYQIIIIRVPWAIVSIYCMPVFYMY